MQLGGMQDSSISELRNADGTENKNSEPPFCKRMTTGRRDRARNRTSVGSYMPIALLRGCKIMQLALSRDRNECTTVERDVHNVKESRRCSSSMELYRDSFFKS